MKKAQYVDKQKIFDIFTKAFGCTIGVNEVKKKDVKRRTKFLIKYSFERCLRPGAVYLPGQKNMEFSKSIVIF